MVDRQFVDPNIAELYDSFCPLDEHGDYDFYLDLVMPASTVLDVGCGTGALLHSARDRGHTGRLCGLDPAIGMMEQARKRSDIEWILGDLSLVDFDREFDLVIMTGHAFQVLVGDDELSASLSKIQSSLTNDGRFAFETRNPSAHGWEQWTADNVSEIVDPAGVAVRSWNEFKAPVAGDLVRFKTTFVSSKWNTPQFSWSTLRFLDVNSLARFLAQAGLEVEAQFGDWDQSPLTDLSPEIITIARRS